MKTGVCVKDERVRDLPGALGACFIDSTANARLSGSLNRKVDYILLHRTLRALWHGDTYRILSPVNASREFMTTEESNIGRKFSEIS